MSNESDVELLNSIRTFVIENSMNDIMSSKKAQEVLADAVSDYMSDEFEVPSSDIEDAVGNSVENYCDTNVSDIVLAYCEENAADTIKDCLEETLIRVFKRETGKALLNQAILNLLKDSIKN